MRYFGGCDAGSTYTKCVILDEAGRIAASVTSRSRIHPVKSAQAALEKAVSHMGGFGVRAGFGVSGWHRLWAQ